MVIRLSIRSTLFSLFLPVFAWNTGVRTLDMTVLQVFLLALRYGLHAKEFVPLDEPHLLDITLYGLHIHCLVIGPPHNRLFLRGGHQVVRRRPYPVYITLPHRWVVLTIISLRLHIPFFSLLLCAFLGDVLIVISLPGDVCLEGSRVRVETPWGIRLLVVGEAGATGMGEDAHDPFRVIA